MARTKRKINPLVQETAEIAPAKKIYKTAAYVRLSVEDSGKPGADTIEGQKALLLSFIENKNDMELISVFCDNGRTGKARWFNGMEAAHGGVVIDGKTIVCGHWHCSFGHANYEGDGGEFDNNPNFSPYYGKGIIALDACTPISRKVNCVVIED